MISNLVLLALILVSAVLVSEGRNGPSHHIPPANSGGFFKPPIATSFVQFRAIATIPVNTTTPTGVVGSSANAGGTVTGSIVGTITPVGAGFERVSNEVNGSVSFYENRYHFQNAKNETFVASVTATIKYANNALHARLGWGRFETLAKGFEHINYNTFLAEVVADFSTGVAEIEFFEINTGGRLDGKPIKALLPPGAEA